MYAGAAMSRRNIHTFFDLQREFGRRLRYIRLNVKKCSVENAAMETGIGPGLWNCLEKGVQMPSDDIMERLLLWIWGGYKFRTLIRQRPWRHRYTRTLHTTFFKSDLARIKAVAKTLGMGHAEFVEFAANLMSRNLTTITHYRQAAREYTKAKLKHALKDKNVSNFFLGDLGLAKKESTLIYEEVTRGKRGHRAKRKMRLNPDFVLNMLEEAIDYPHECYATLQEAEDDIIPEADEAIDELERELKKDIEEGREG
jgi:hypothetical protein